MIYTVGVHTSVRIDLDSTPLRSLVWYADKVKSDIDEKRKREELQSQMRG